MGRFTPGKSGNPDGRPLGSKNRFTELKKDILDAYYIKGKGVEGELCGVKFWRMLKTDHPLDFARIVAGLLPKEIKADLTIEDARTMFKQFEIIVLQEVKDNEVRKRIAAKLREAASP